MTVGTLFRQQWGPLRERWPDAARWAASFAVVLFTHVGVAAALLANWDEGDLMPNAPIITIELAAEATSVEETPPDIPVGVQQTETPPEEEEPPPQQADIQLEQPKPPPPEKKKPVKVTTAPAPAKKRAPVAAAPAPGASSANAYAVPNWKSQLVSQLERNKRYPSDARARGDQGVAYLSFTVDRSGGVHGARISRSSGSSALDQETVALAYRASPLPPPPPEMGGSIPVVVPIRYNIR